MTKRYIVLTLWFFLGLYACFTLTKSLVQLYQASKRVTTQQSKLEILQSEVGELQQKLRKVGSLEYVEEEARNKLNLQRPGEVVVMMPKERLESDGSGLKSDSEPRNWEKWLTLFK